MGLSEAFLTRGDSLFIYTSPDMINGKTLLVVSPWLLFCIEALIVSAFFVLLSIRLVRPVRYKKAASTSEAAVNKIAERLFRRIVRKRRLLIVSRL